MVRFLLPKVVEISGEPTPRPTAIAKPRPKGTSGIEGDSLIDATSALGGFTLPYDYDLIIKDVKNSKVVQKIRTTGGGDFTISLRPGQYTIEVIPGQNGQQPSITLPEKEDVDLWRNGRWQVTVQKGHYTRLHVRFPPL
jgi:hypothetical protein